MISKKKVFNLGGGPLLGDPKHGEELYTAPRHCDQKKLSCLGSRFFLFLNFFLFFLTCHRRPGATMKK